MTVTAIIGGTGLSQIEGLVVARREMVRTPWGQPSGPLLHGNLYGQPVVFLARHGQLHTLPPHRINYRANVWALAHAGASRIIAVAAVGGVDPVLTPPSLVLPDQLIDYTSDREHTFYEGGDAASVVHVDFREPYDSGLRQALADAAESAAVAMQIGGVYGVTQGPRCETAAEVLRMQRDGCSITGMTGMPEAVLARELGVPYAPICVVVSRAGVPPAHGDPALEQAVERGVDSVRSVIAAVLK